MMNVIVLSFLIIVVEASRRNSHYNQPCVTPNGDKGKCVDIISCTKISNISKQYPDYVKRAYCGKKNNKQLVCCGDNYGFQYKCGEFYTYTKILTRRRVVKSRIYNGEKTVESELPWLVVLTYNTPRNSASSNTCVGSLINANFVLTAAHCVNDELESIQIRDMVTNQHFHKQILKKIVHDVYESTRNVYYDIALLKIRPVFYSGTMRWICLPTSKFVLSSDFTIAGYGGNNMERAPFSLQMKEIVRKNPEEKCNHEEVQSNFKPSNIICAGTTNRLNNCIKDSGGPVMTLNNNTSKYTLVGIIGNDMSCEISSKSYIKVVSFVKWIEKTMLKNL